MIPLDPTFEEKVEKSSKTRVPLRKMEESKMAAAVCQNWHFQPFWHIFEYFSLVKTYNFMFFDAKESISEGFIKFWLFVLEKRAILFKIQARALFNDFSHIKTDLLLKRYQSKRKSHDWWAREISALFHRYFAHSVHFKCSFCLP